ncbi:MAG TPA: hypothetical protein VN619_02305 [Lacisediminihabitans sp.]|nr:hypothetical protein [Lacisediminihabitans sp.]HXD60740.1 hypothetical protein [Lacisediminihabitans sp.]
MRGTRTPHRLGGRAAAALCLALAVSGIGAAPAPAAAPAALCIPLLMPCSTPSPSPSPSPSPLVPLPNPVPNPLDGTAPAAPPTPAEPDPSAPIFTLPAAQLGGSSISFTGLHGVSVVTVPLIDGSRTPVIKIAADEIVIKGFMLDVRKATGPSLVSTADQMTLHGHVQVYLDSATATLPDGTGIALGAATPPPGNELPPTLLRVNLGLVGVTADSIFFTNSHQEMK